MPRVSSTWCMLGVFHQYEASILDEYICSCILKSPWGQSRVRGSTWVLYPPITDDLKICSLLSLSTSDCLGEGYLPTYCRCLTASSRLEIASTSPSNSEASLKGSCVRYLTGGDALRKLREQQILRAWLQSRGLCLVFFCGLQSSKSVMGWGFMFS